MRLKVAWATATASLIILLTGLLAYAMTEDISDRFAATGGGGQLQDGGVNLFVTMGQPLAGATGDQGNGTLLCSGFLCGGSANIAPVANAGPDQTVGLNAVVQLDGGGSHDPDANQPLAYQWTQIGGASVTLSDSTTVTPMFTAPEVPTTLIFALTVTDNKGLESVAGDAVVITVTDDLNPNQFPIYLPIIEKSDSQ